MSINDITGTIDSLYSGLQSTWEKIQADVIVHLIVVFVVFKFIGVSLPHLHIPDFDLPKIRSNEWFQFAKETGILYLLPFVIISIVIIYGAILRVGGRSLVIANSLLFLPEVDVSRLLKRFPKADLETIALQLNDEYFKYEDILIRINELIVLYKQNIRTSIKPS